MRLRTNSVIGVGDRNHNTRVVQGGSDFPSLIDIRTGATYLIESIAVSTLFRALFRVENAIVSEVGSIDSLKLIQAKGEEIKCTTITVVHICVIKAYRQR